MYDLVMNLFHVDMRHVWCLPPHLLLELIPVENPSLLNV